MGYAGQPMKVIKANKALLRKRNTFKEVKKMFLETSDKTELEFKEVSPLRLAQIKSEIRRKAKITARTELFIFIICSLTVLSFFYWLLFT